MKTVLIYSSKSHGNTKKLADAVAAEYGVELIDAEQTTDADLSEYGRIGFASGIAFSRFYGSVTAFAEKNLPENKNVFFLCTCGRKSAYYFDELHELADKRHCKVIGSYECLGLDTYGFLGWFGGINKNHPTDEEIRGAVDFYKEVSR